MAGGKKGPRTKGFRPMNFGPGAGKPRSGKAKGGGKGKAPIIVVSKKKEPARRISIDPGVTFRLPTEQPIPTLFADGKWAPLSGSISRVFASPVVLTSTGSVVTRRVLCVVNNGSSSNILMDFGEVTSGTLTSATLATSTVPVFPAGSGGLTSTKCGRNGFTMVMTSPPGQSVGQVHVYRGDEREYLLTTAPTQDQVFLLSESIVNKTSCEHLAPSAFASKRAWFNKPRSVQTYSEFNRWDSTLSASSHLLGFTYQVGPTPFPMSALWIILDAAVIPTAATNLVPANYSLTAMLQLGTRWDSDHPMSSTTKIHPTVTQASLNGGLR